MLTIAEWEFVGRLVLAAVLGGLIGWEREQAQRPAGLRTNMLVALGSALFTILSLKAFDSPLTDPSRVAAQIIVGIGFIGAGTLVRTGEWVRGLTTAAGLWTVAAIGMAVGAGYYVLAMACTLIALVILVIVRFFEATKS
jgi:putative Mg2+ transporter-C (MgtC) family protein